MIHTDEDDEFARIERENAMKGQPYNWEANAIKSAINLERKACADIAEWCIQNHLEHHIPERIRARGKHDTR
jgi:hypothetical protein